MGLPEIYLIIEKGEPFEAGSTVPLRTQESLLGRPTKSQSPEIGFTSQYISRNHALIKIEEHYCTILDLGSKHGTSVNGHVLAHRTAHQLNHGDRISLAKDAAILTFNNPMEGDSDETVNFTSALPLRSENSMAGLVINLDRREVLADGIPVQLFGKDLDLLLLLYYHKNKAVSYAEIKKSVWSERAVEGTDMVPDVGSDEITALVYRLRKRLAGYGHFIISIPRYGYMLDLQ